MIVDVGTGDGRAVLARARLSPDDLILGIDASATAMADASRRAAAKPARGGLPNARFFVDAAESLPGPLAGTADIVTVKLPWGSLLLGVLGRDVVVMAGLAGTLRSSVGARLESFVSVTARDHVPGIECLTAAHATAIAAAWAGCGLSLRSFRPATAEELNATGSSWARRLGDRPVWRLELVR